MLTDIFADRYLNRQIWKEVGPAEKRLLTQAFVLLKEDVIPYWTKEGKVNETYKPHWESIQKKLSRELGIESLSPFAGGYWNQFNGNKNWVGFTHSLDKVCETFVLADYSGSDPDRWMKERLSLIELGFREKHNDIERANFKLSLHGAEERKRLDQTVQLINKLAEFGQAPGKYDSINNSTVALINQELNRKYEQHAHELNVRFQRAGVPLNYHNGFIQIAADEQVEGNIATPFWKLVSDPKWANVDTDMKEAVDRRESNDRDPSMYAAKALESTIKIISWEKGFTRGTEKNANHYIDNLVSEKNGRFIEVWEGDALRHIFKETRNDFVHGPGEKPMPALTKQQVDWAIESCMSWIKSLIGRLK